MEPTDGSAWLRVLPEALSVPLAVTSAGMVVYANPALEELLGEMVDGLAGRQLDDLLSGLAPGRLETRARSVEIDGVEDALLVEIEDVSERLAAEGQLNELARFPDMNPGPVLRLAEDGMVLRANAAALRLPGADGIVGSSWLAFADLGGDNWSRMLRAGSPLLHETQLGDLCFQFTYVPSSQDEAVFAFGADITALRAAERTAAELARFPDMNPGPVLRTDWDGYVLLANRAARAVLGDVVGSRWLGVLPECADRWPQIRQAAETVSLEVRRHDRDFVFTHQADPENHLVFIYGSDITLQKRTDQALRQSERMATLGTLVAGVAHELNNPAAATRRAADQLRDAMAELEASHLQLDRIAKDAALEPVLRPLDERARSASTAAVSLDTLTRGDREVEIEEWLEGQGVAEPWELAPSLVELGLDLDALDELTADLPPALLVPVLRWACRTFDVYRLAHEIGQGAGRISEIVGALKGYSYLGQGPAQDVDLHESLDNTLVILRHKLKRGIDVHRDYSQQMPKVPAFGSELNQVWTNILDNAIGAMGGTGTITIATRRDGDHAVVTIEDDGPGIAPEDLPRVFDPFFTTKEPGEGTGLGLSTSYSIITEKHGGRLEVSSEPGRTTFTARLPLERKEGT